MSLRETLRNPKNKAVDAQVLPAWVVQGSETTQALYNAASTELIRVKVLIEQKKLLSPKERKIVASHVARIAERDRSIINTRRQAELVDWIDRANESLAKLYELHKPSKSRIKTENPHKQIVTLRKQLKSLQETNAKEFVDRIFDSNLLDNRDKLATEVITLRRVNTELLKKIDILQDERQKQDRKISLLLVQLGKL